jgi:hypothetical protein
MLGVLQKALGHDRVAGGLRVARELKIFLGDMLSRAANLNVGAIGLIGSRKRIRPFAAVASPHSLVLSWSHQTPRNLAALGSRLRGFPNNVAAKFLRQKQPTRNARTTALHSRTASFKSGARESIFLKLAAIGGPA